MTIRVGRGSSAPISLNMVAKVGMTNVSMKTMTRKATPMMEAGYTMAPFTFRFRAAAFST